MSAGTRIITLCVFIFWVTHRRLGSYHLLYLCRWQEDAGEAGETMRGGGRLLRGCLLSLFRCHLLLRFLLINVTFLHTFLPQELFYKHSFKNFVVSTTFCVGSVCQGPLWNLRCFCLCNLAVLKLDVTTEQAVALTFTLNPHWLTNLSNALSNPPF